MEQTLLLNATYEPLKIVHWQKAVTLWCQGKVEVIVCLRPRDPRGLLQLQAAVGHPPAALHQDQAALRLRAVLAREHLRARRSHCQYCGDGFPTSELTFDHVVPVAQGGRKDWENIVTCCVTCNRTKGGRTPAEAGMHLAEAPQAPDSAPAVRITVGLRNAPESWRDYLYWNVELDDT